MFHCIAKVLQDVTLAFRSAPKYIKSRKEMECCIEMIFIIIILLGIIPCLGNLLLLSSDNSLLSEHVDGYQHGIFTVCKNTGQEGRELLDVDSVPLMLQSITSSNKMQLITSSKFF